MSTAPGGTAPRRAVLLAAAVMSTAAACGDSSEDSTPAVTAATDAESSEEPSAGLLEAEITTILEDAMEPEAIDWSKQGTPLPPTAVTAGVRMEGGDDVLAVVGTQVDGSPASPTDPLPVSSLTGALTRTVALQLVDEGELDPDATVEAWAPAMPGADAVTVRSMIEMTTGWSGSDDLGQDVVVDDLERRWTLAEVVDFVSPNVTRDSDPSVATTHLLLTDLVLGHVLEQVTGEALADLVDARIAGPLGLDDTAIVDGTPLPGHRHGVFLFNGTDPVDTSMFPGTAFFTFHTATTAAVSSVPDLLDLLDVWQEGSLFSTERVPGPERFGAERATSVTDPVSYDGLGVPFNGYCPCSPAEGGHDVTAVGRTPAWTVLGSDAHVLRYADGTSVVLHFNSGQVVDRARLRAVADAIHAAAAASNDG